VKPLFASLALAAAPLCGGCQLLFGSQALPTASPSLADLEEPLAYQEEPRDEQVRKALAPGSFTGLVVADARATLDDMLSEPEGILVSRVVENSPGEAAEIEEGDLLLTAQPAGEEPVPLHWPSQWRELELRLPPGTELALTCDRAGVERRATLVLQARIKPAEREPTVRLREEDRVGVVLRSATEVEARADGLGPGGGAVIVGLAAASPWRAAGLCFEDLILSVDGVEVAHPQVVLDAIRSAKRGGALQLVVERASLRPGESRLELDAPVSRRERQLTHVSFPILFSYEKERGASETSLLLGALLFRRTPAAWDLRLLWLLNFGGGDSDRLQQVKF
jgi:S1-C subfamily serine protease